VYTNLFGGAGEVRVWSLLRGPSEPFTAVVTCELAPGGAVGRHVQQEFPELVLGIAGDGELRVDGVPHRLGPHSAVHLPLGATLEIANRSESEPLRYLIVKARAQLAERPAEKVG
jgi:quercetin dioxygenase-like cupin family protein